ncbi:MAG: peptide chain release factor N(5)-glutamine methyltransferase [Clostridiales bacterium]|nr:peptide chain release factor N(5)-glutamine methyltransferase [Clostridiales bacterium]
MEIRACLNLIEESLRAGGVAEAACEARLILGHLLDCRPGRLLLREGGVEGAVMEEALQIARRRTGGQPLQYLLGVQQFMGLDFLVNENTLIPRWDTEPMVDEAIRLMRSYESPLIADLCCGGGAIAVSIAKALPPARLLAADICPEALQTARQNAQKHGVEKHIEFLCGDLLAPLRGREGKLDMLVCNPPYIPCGEIATLSPEVRREPRLALDGGADGLDFYRRLAAGATPFLKEEGWLVLEMGDGQKEEVCRILLDGGWQIERVTRDLARRERAVFARKSM